MQKNISTINQKVNPLELQLKEYDTLPIFSSYRKRGSIIIIIYFIVDFFLSSYLSGNSIDYILILYLMKAVIFVPLIIFCYKGYRGAMMLIIGGSILYISSIVGLDIFQIQKWQDIIILASIPLIFGIVDLFKALKVENERKKRKWLEIKNAKS